MQSSSFFRRCFSGRTVAALRIGGATLAAIALLSACKKPTPPSLPPPTVEVMTVKSQDVPITKTWVGTLSGEVNAQIGAQVTGYLLEQVYQNGQFVDKGDVLFQIDPRPFQAALDQAMGSLAQAEATLKASLLTAQRANELYATQVISQQQYDDQTQAYFAAKAKADAAQAAVDQAKLNLEFTRIVSPIDGLSSIATAQVGDLVGPSTGTLATVTQVNPIKVNFSVAEQEYIGYIEQFFSDPESSPMSGSTSSGKGSELTLVLTLSNGFVYPRTGELTAINNTVAANTGTIELEGRFPNPGNLLRPGQFGLVNAVVRTEPNAILVPQRAVMDLQGQSQIALIAKDNTVQIRNITTGPKIGSMWLIASGLQEGDTIVVEGVQKIRDGMVVKTAPYTLTKPEADSVLNQLPGTSNAMPEAVLDPSQPTDADAKPTPNESASPLPSPTPSASPSPAAGV